MQVCRGMISLKERWLFSKQLHLQPGCTVLSTCSSWNFPSCLCLSPTSRAEVNVHFIINRYQQWEAYGKGMFFEISKEKRKTQKTQYFLICWWSLPCSTRCNVNLRAIANYFIFLFRAYDVKGAQSPYFGGWSHIHEWMQDRLSF